MKDKSGFTLIELIMVLGLAGIVISVVMSFFIANYKSYQTINTESEVQYQSQYIINYMTNKILEAKSFDDTVKKFEYFDGKTASFILDEHNNKIKYIYDTEPAVNIGNHVIGLEIIPHGANTNEVKIILELEKGSGTYEAEQIVYMRNSAN